MEVVLARRVSGCSETSQEPVDRNAPSSSSARAPNSRMSPRRLFRTRVLLILKLRHQVLRTEIWSSKNFGSPSRKELQDEESTWKSTEGGAQGGVRAPEKMIFED